MKKIIVLIFILLVLFLAISPVSLLAVETENKAVRIGWFDYPGSSETHDGEHTGYTYDYLMEIAKYTGWEYTFVEEDFATCCSMLIKGDIDIIGGLQQTPEREQILGFTDLPYCQAYTVLFTSVNSSLQPYDYENFEGIKVGYLKDALTPQHLEKFASNNGFTYKLEEFETSDDIHEALNNNTIDAGLLLSYVPTQTTRIVAKFSPTPISFVTTKGNTEILSGLNRAINLIKINRLYFDVELYEKYYVAKESMELTEDERIIVEKSQNEPLLVGVINNYAPISYWNNKSQNCEGLIVEIFNTICKKTGLNVKYIPVELTSDKKVISKNDDLPQLVIGVPNFDSFNKNSIWHLSNSLFDEPLAIVGRTGSELDKIDKKNIVAVVKDFEIAQDYIKEKFSDYEIIEYPTLEDCMKAVVDGDADNTIYYQSSINYYQQKPYFSDLKFVTVDTESIGLCVGGFTTEVQPLIRIIDKGMSRILESEIRTLTINTTMLNPYPLTISDIFYKYRVPLIIIGLLLGAVTTVIIAFLIVKRRNSEKLTLAYEQKNAALIEAKKASAAKGNFMSRMSHEIRTPLNAVIGYNTIARNELTEAKTEVQRKQSEMKVMDCLTKSEIASRHLLTIINDVLDMSAIESGKINVVNEKFDFKGLISSLTAIFYSQAKSKCVDFNVEFDSQMDEWIIGDQMRVNQILTNLLSNAIKFTSDGGKVTMRIHPQTEEDLIKIRFEVIDTGIGMTDEYISRIWNPFEQADSSISRRFGGTGLGLSITKSLVDLLKGNITVKSKIGEGTIFTLELSFSRMEQPENKGAYDFSGINALIVDDDISTCDYIKLLLTRCSVRNSAVYSGEEAVLAVKKSLDDKKPYTVCLIDWRMPKMDGLETIKRIRDITGDNLPIIVITAYDFSEIADQAAKLGVNMFISKPLFQSSIFNLLTNISGCHIHHDTEKTITYDFSGIRILLAEDNAMNMEIARNILESAKFIVDNAWNGKEAVDMFLNAPQGTYSAILMDVQMPVIDGYQAAKIIRNSNHPEAKSMPIIAMTADAFAENIAESRAAGMDDHISKPIDFVLLFQTLKQFIHKK